MGSKLTVHARRPNVEQLIESGARYVKLQDWDSEMDVDTLRKAGVEVIFRQVDNGNYDSITPEQKVATLPAKLMGRGVWFEGINEPIINDALEAVKLSTWYWRFAELMHERGERCLAYSFPTGHPKLHLIRYLIDGYNACDGYAFHEYHLQFGEYRKARYEFERNGANEKPWFITETGVDFGGNPRTDGWRARGFSNAQYMEILRNYDAMLMQDDYIKCATVFTLDDPTWPSFEIQGIVKELLTYIRSNPTPVAPAPVPAKPKTPNMEKILQVALILEQYAKSMEAQGLRDWAHKVRGAGNVIKAELGKIT